MVRFTKIQSKHKEILEYVGNLTYFFFFTNKCCFFSNADFKLTVSLKIMIHLKSLKTYLVSVGTILHIFVDQQILNIARDICPSI